MKRREGQRARVIVVDDHAEMADTLADGLVDLGFDAVSVSKVTDAHRLLREGTHDALVTDLRIPGTDGLELLALSRESAPGSPVIVMTAFSAIDSAVESIRRGAYHYLTKPFKVAELALFLSRALDESAVRREARTLRTALEGSIATLVGASAAMRKLTSLVRRLADSDVSALILGETGTGKGLVARALHVEGPRAAGPFVAINCAAIPEGLLESELFGHVKGAFTGANAAHVGLFEQAQGGTLFLDEIGEMSPALQAKLLHVLETGRVRPLGGTRERTLDARVVSATHRDLRARVRSGTFREDLLYRLDVVSVEVPALRSRREDIPMLLARFLASARARTPAAPLRRLSADATHALTAYDWPGNVRELEHLAERLVVLCSSETAELDDLPPSIRSSHASGHDLEFGEAVLPFRELQTRYARWALEKLGGRKMATCEALGIDSKTLARWLAGGRDGEGGEER